MKQHICDRFLPLNYEHQLYKQYQEFSQKNRTLIEYVDEFYKLNDMNNLQETEIRLVSRFLNGLKDQIRDKLSLHTLWTLSEVVNLALKVETKLARQNTRPSYQRRFYNEN